ncbi:PDZ domain-containing protein [Zancudomyces culisetae]|uniref:Pro-apoptotic serine protease NMA111 n=1 Tax=Zancudomyces culisetae TaxID=1213189 RepID=A0A1R1PPC7_ZANCU|nr:PDZ domain-containing protein [Zancudomyces culisetae]|eukprot:OMH82817.1 PDZ domain-containing protein [Zancudomyces culisetae]
MKIDTEEFAENDSNQEFVNNDHIQFHEDLHLNLQEYAWHDINYVVCKKYNDRDNQEMTQTTSYPDSIFEEQLEDMKITDNESLSHDEKVELTGEDLEFSSTVVTNEELRALIFKEDEQVNGKDKYGMVLGKRDIEGDLKVQNNTFEEELVVEDTPMWERVIRRALNGIVSIKTSCVFPFDTEGCDGYVASGFIVDAERGIILSNRHVVSPAPTVAVATLKNYEEIELQPLYIDPVHDFGFFKFDPAKIKFMDIMEIKLAPHKAKVGLEIRVVGSDGGEKISITSGTLARLDRRPPTYIQGSYNDFNTFYMQAASGNASGSSGSPVLDIEGDAVGLNAGHSKKAASSYYFPLTRVARALEYIKRGERVPRGTIQTRFERMSYNELRRLNLSMDIERKMRETYPDETGMLIVKKVLQEGPADKQLNNGDILVALNGTAVINFDQVSDVLDSNVDKTISLTIWRNRKAYNVFCKVQDLYSITPRRFIEVGGGIVNELSYQVASSYHVPVKGVFVADEGYMLSSADIHGYSIILSINQIPTPTLEEFARVLTTLTSGSIVPVKFFRLHKPYREVSGMMRVNCQWFPLRLAERNLDTGIWEFTALEGPKLPLQISPTTVIHPRIDPKLSPAHAVYRSFVDILFSLPYLVDGVCSTQYYGPGYVIDSTKGLVLCDRDTVTAPLGDLYIDFAHSLVVKAHIVFLHPVYNFAILKYEPERLGDTKVDQLEFAPEYWEGTKRLEQGDKVVLVAMDFDSTLLVRRTLVSSRQQIRVNDLRPPQWRNTNVQGVFLKDQPNCQGGLITDEAGLVISFWANTANYNPAGDDISFMSGFDASLLKPVIDALKNGLPITMRSLGAEFTTIRSSHAKLLGLSQSRLNDVFSKVSSSHPEFYYVSNLQTGDQPDSDATNAIKCGDVVLEINGSPALDITDLAVLYDNSSHADLRVLREGKEISLRVPSSKLEPLETKHVIVWGGIILQEPYRALLGRTHTLPSRVYVVSILTGSSAHASGLDAGHYISEINSVKLNSLLDLVLFLKSYYSENPTSNSDFFKLTVHNRFGISKIINIKSYDLYFSPTQIYLSDNYEWKVNFGVERFDSISD